MATLSALVICGCANPAEEILKMDPGTRLYERSRNPAPDDTYAARFLAAYDDLDPAALRANFAEALSLLEADGFNPSETVGLSWVLQVMLARFGDKRFAAVLAGESPRTQSAVGYFMVTGSGWTGRGSSTLAKRYPKTERILSAAPEISWPADKAADEFYSN